MANLILKEHSIDIQKELENLADSEMMEHSDIPLLIKKIVTYALEHRDEFQVTGQLSYKAREFEKKESDKEYKIEIAQEVKQNLVLWAQDRLDTKGGKVKKLLLKQTKFILLVYFAKGLNYKGTGAVVNNLDGLHETNPEEPGSQSTEHPGAA